MAQNLEMYCLGDPLHFSSPATWQPEWDIDFSTDCSEGRSDDSGIWHFHRAAGIPLADQGWKIHVSSTSSDAFNVLTIVRAICAEQQVSYKHLNRMSTLVALNSKGADRSASGKFIAVYPTNVSEFRLLAEHLAVELQGFDGPHVLTDCRWKDGAPVFFRYGAFRSIFSYSPAGKRVLARKDGKGNLIEDSRSIPFALPTDISVPDFITTQLALLPVAEAMPFHVNRAIQFSNTGGIYEGSHPSDNKAIVLKEARAHTGFYPNRLDATGRLNHEASVLKDLMECDFVPNPVASFKVWEHRFLALEKMPGLSLRAWAAVHHPALRFASGRGEFDEYRMRCELILTDLSDKINRLHGHGLAHNDINPGNVIVDENLVVSLIDFEAAGPANSTSQPPIACPGFVPSEGDGRERDLYALGVMRLWLLYPALSGLHEADINLVRNYSLTASRWFGLDDDYFTELKQVMWLKGRRVPSARVLARSTKDRVQGPLPPISEDNQSLGAYLTSVANPTGSQLFPCDPLSFTEPVSALSLGYGAAGILLSLSNAGYELPEDWLDWMRQRHAAVVDSRTAPGLWDGLGGLAVFWAAQSDHARALEALAQAKFEMTHCNDLSVQSGLAGYGLATLALARLLKEPALCDEVGEIAERIVVEFHRQGRPRGPAGLLGGGSGIARFLMRAAEVHTEPNWIAVASTALSQDLRQCDTDSANSLHLKFGNRRLPYLGDGGMGVALAQMDFRIATGRPAIDATVESLARASMVELMAEASFTSGRAGVTYGLLQLAAAAGDTSFGVQSRDWARKHRDLLSLHTVRVTNGTAVGGRGGFRLAADLATGAAGPLSLFGLADCSGLGASSVVLDILTGSPLRI